MYSQKMMNKQIGAHRTYRSLADIVAAVTLLMTTLEKRLVEADGDEDGGRQHYPTWMADDP
jgi:hypothetical protein